MKEKQIKNFERNIKIAVAGLALVVVVLGICSFLQFTKPYAVTEDGTKVEEPWEVKIGDEKSFVVASEKDGKDIIEQVKNSYSTENTQSEATTLYPEIQVVEKELERGDRVEELTEPEDAVKQVVADNETGPPLVMVTTVEHIEKTRAIDYKTKYKESDDLYVGQEKVIKKGKKGKKTVVNQVVKENGKTVSKEVVSAVVEEEPKNRIVERGTKEPEDGMPESSSVSQYDASGSSASGGTESGKAAGSSDSGSSTVNGSGQDVADYALQFVGNPYVYGGTSLTNGADCSGFTMSVFAKFGVSLPHSSSAQRSYGREVSYSEAKPGDLICYSGHVAIYIGNGKIVHASTPSTGIKVSTATYREILTVRRLVE